MEVWKGTVMKGITFDIGVNSSTITQGKAYDLGEG